MIYMCLPVEVSIQAGLKAIIEEHSQSWHH
jgi:hypothetical protein